MPAKPMTHAGVIYITVAEFVAQYASLRSCEYDHCLMDSGPSSAHVAALKLLTVCEIM